MFLYESEQNLNLEEKYLCLDFINTLDWRRRDPPTETLHNYTDLLDWAQDTGLLDAGDAAALREQAEQDPELANRVYTRAMELRESAYAIIMAGIERKAAPQEDLDRLSEILSGALANPRLLQSGSGFRLGWQEDHREVGWFLSPIARSVLNLLSNAELDRVKECESEQGCGWLFYDTSRNKSRRWCSMESCGNRAKAASFYQRHKQEH